MKPYASIAVAKAAAGAPRERCGSRRFQGPRVGTLSSDGDGPRKLISKSMGQLDSVAVGRICPGILLRGRNNESINDPAWNVLVPVYLLGRCNVAGP